MYKLSNLKVIIVILLFAINNSLLISASSKTNSKKIISKALIAQINVKKNKSNKKHKPKPKIYNFGNTCNRFPCGSRPGAVNAKVVAYPAFTCRRFPCKNLV